MTERDMEHSVCGAPSPRDPGRRCERRAGHTDPHRDFPTDPSVAEVRWPFVPPVGTIANVEERIAVLIGKDGGWIRWQWMNGDWASIPLGGIDVLGHVADLATRVAPPVERRTEDPAPIANWSELHDQGGEG